MFFICPADGLAAKNKTNKQIITMIKRRCIFGMYPLKNSDFVTRVRESQTKLLAPGFSTVTPAPAVIVPMLDQMAIWIGESLAKDYRNSAAMQAMRADLNRLVSQQVTSVNSIAQGDVNILILSGFELNKIPTPITEPEEGEINKVKNIGGGTVIIYMKRIPNCILHEIEITGPNNFFYYDNSFYPKIKVPNLPVGVTLYVVMRGKNHKGVGPWSAPVTFVVNIAPQGAPTNP